MSKHKTVDTIIYDNYDNSTQGNKCKCCNGTGIQFSWITGLKDICPACRGTGHWSDAIKNNLG